MLDSLIKLPLYIYYFFPISPGGQDGGPVFRVGFVQAWGPPRPEEDVVAERQGKDCHRDRRAAGEEWG